MKKVIKKTSVKNKKKISLNIILLIGALVITIILIIISLSIHNELKSLQTSYQTLKSENTAVIKDRDIYIYRDKYNEEFENNLNTALATYVKCQNTLTSNTSSVTHLDYFPSNIGTANCRNEYFNKTKDIILERNSSPVHY